MNIRKTLQGVMTSIFVLLLSYLACTNLVLIREPLEGYKNKELTFAEAKDVITSAYPEKLKQKYQFINLNGLFVRLTGGRVCNDIVLLKNKMLTDAEVPEVDTSQNAYFVQDLSHQLESIGIDFLYVQSPAKMDLNNELCPTGIENEGNHNADQLVNELENNGVDVLDLRKDMADSEEHISQYFYKTDHHWNPFGAFKAFGEICEHMGEKYPEIKENSNYWDINNWEVNKKEKWFLGSRGKRTGVYFAGVDDLIWLTPKFGTEMSFGNVYNGEFYYGDYSYANIRDKYINEKDYFEYNAYGVYVGGDFKLVKHRNNNAPVKKKMLFVKESFGMPLETFFSTLFSEVDVIDMRYYKTGSLDEYILDSTPDMVIMNVNAYDVGETNIFGTGADVALDQGEFSKIFENDSILINMDSENDLNMLPVYSGIEAGKRYKLTVDDVYVTEGATDAISLYLHDANDDSYYDADMWDLNYCKNNGKYEWTFTAPYDAGNLDLVVFSGIIGKTSGSGIGMSGINLYEYTY